ncbi:MAG: S8 family serine peptidase [Candidatus Heimdallarchaeota archaeon]|nr:S8 family serine peptidase [Candidatus Heimdallarchaeota archaeon]
MRNKLSFMIFLFLLISVFIYRPITKQSFNNQEYIVQEFDYSKNEERNSIEIDGLEADWSLIMQESGLNWMHNEGYNGSGIKVGIIDNGIDITHEAFSEVVVYEKNFFNGTIGGSKTHGTAVAGVMVGNNNDVIGTSPGITIYSAEMLSNEEDTSIDGDFKGAMQWFVENEVSVVNISFGGHENWTEMIEIARANNIIIVGSVGNDGYNNPPSGPGADKYSIGVGALSNVNKVEYYSSRGPTSDYLQKPDLVDFGTINTIDVISGSSIKSGTSYSTPLVVGGIASVLSALKISNDNWTVDEIKSALLKSCKFLDDDFNAQGAGRANFTLMLELIRSGNGEGYITKFLPKEYEEIPIGVNELILPIQILGGDDIEINGNISSIIYSNELEFGEIKLYVNSTENNIGLYDGLINLRKNDVIIFSRNITIELHTNLKGRIGFQLYYSSVYQSGEFNLLSSNSYASKLRENGFILEYIFSPFSKLDHSDFEIIYFIQPFGYEMTDDQELTGNDLSWIKSFIQNNGDLFLIFSSPKIINDIKIGSDIDKINSLINEFGMNIGNNIGDIIPNIGYTVRNSSYFGKNEKYIQQEGFLIQGGLTFFDTEAAFIAYNSSSTGRFLVSSSMEILDEIDFLIDIMLWMSAGINYQVKAIDFSENDMTIKYRGDERDQLLLRTYNFENDEIFNITNYLPNNIMNDIYEFNVSLQLGVNEIIIWNNNTYNYIKLLQTEFSRLRYDNIKPILLNNSIYLNGSVGNSHTVRLNYIENDGLDIFNTSVIINNEVRFYILDKEFSIIEFTLLNSDFNQSDQLIIKIDLVDLSGNIQRYEILSEIFYMESDISIDTSNYDEITIQKYSDEIELPQGEYDIQNQFIAILIGIATIISIVVIIKEGKL